MMNKKNPEIEAMQKQELFAREQMSMQNVEAVPDQLLIQKAEEQEDLMRWQQDLSDELEILKHELAREIKVGDAWKRKQITIGYNPETGVAIKRDVQPYMNEIGIDMVQTVCRPLLSRNMINTNLDEDRILHFLKQTSNVLVRNIRRNRTRFGMSDDITEASLVVRMIKNVIIPAPFRALNDGERRHQRTISKRLETFSESGMRKEEKKGLFGLMGGG